MAVIAKKIRKPLEGLLEKEARQMLAMYQNFAGRAERQMAPMYAALDAGQPPSYAMSQLMRVRFNINNEITALEKHIEAWEKGAFPKIYAGGQIDGIIDLGKSASDSIKFAQGVMSRRTMDLLNEEISYIQDSKFHKNALSILEDTLYTGKNIDATVRDRYNRALAQMGRTITAGFQSERIEETAGRRWDDTFRALGLDTASSVVAGEMSWDQAMRKELRMFEQMGIGSFQDAGGNVWHLKSYAEMVARTVPMHVMNVGKMNEFLEYGEDLVIVSEFSPTCPLCELWGGRVLSISGKTKGYRTVAMAENAGLFHPNCQHSFALYLPELYGASPRKLPEETPQLT